MGSFYTNVTVRHARADDVVAALRSRGRDAFVSPSENGCVVVFDAVTEEQDSSELERLALALSKRLDCAALAVLVHDDDLLYYVLFESGRMTDEYSSRPGLLDGSDRPPEGGVARTLAAAFDRHAAAGEVERVLRARDYPFETERHAALVEALGLPLAAIAAGFRYIEAGELPEGVAAADLVSVGTASVGQEGGPASGLTAEEAAVVRARLESWVLPSPALADLCGAEPLQYQAAIAKVIHYVVGNGLAQGTEIRPDPLLRTVLGEGPVSFGQLPDRLRPHFTPLDAPPPGA